MKIDKNSLTALALITSGTLLSFWPALGLPLAPLLRTYESGLLIYSIMLVAGGVFFAAGLKLLAFPKKEWKSYVLVGVLGAFFIFVAYIGNLPWSY